MSAAFWRSRSLKLVNSGVIASSYTIFVLLIRNLDSYRIEATKRESASTAVLNSTQVKIESIQRQRFNCHKQNKNPRTKQPGIQKKNRASWNYELIVKKKTFENIANGARFKMNTKQKTAIQNIFDWGKQFTWWWCCFEECSGMKKRWKCNWKSCQFDRRNFQSVKVSASGHINLEYFSLFFTLIYNVRDWKTSLPMESSSSSSSSRWWL